MKQSENVGKIIRWVVIVLIAAALIGLMLINAMKPKDHTEAVWSEGTTLGKLDAKNYYIYYTDLACPYCDAFSKVLFDNKDDFVKDYIEGKDILYEVRVTDFLYNYGEHKPEMSRWSAEGVYCARAESKFWEYYQAAIEQLYADYFSSGIGTSKTAPSIEGMTAEYWQDLGHKIGLGESFDSYFTEHKMLSEIEENTARAAKQVDGGLPYFKFNKFTTGGFDPSWDYDYVKRYLDAGL